MKVLINIPNETLEDIKNGFYGEHYGDFRKLAIAIGNGTPIPENVTNGDMIKAMFPDLCLQYNDIYIEGGGDLCVTQDIINDLYFEYSWWNAPYKGV